MKNKPSQNLTLSIVVVLFIVGFWIVMSDLSELKQKVANLDSNMEILYGDIEPIGPSGSDNDSTNQNQGEEVASVSTAILFEKESSPLLSPQANLTVTVEEVSKDSEGLVTVDFRVFTDEANSYSAFDSVNAFESVVLGSASQKPLRTRGSLDSIPPQSAVNGEVVFKIDENEEEFILQINGNEGVKFYLFNFEDGSYEETVLG